MLLTGVYIYLVLSPRLYYDPKVSYTPWKGEQGMEAVRIKERIKKDGEILLTGLPFKKGQRVEMIVMSEPARRSSKPSTARQLLASGIVGMWKERGIADSSVYARTLRERAQRRDNR